MDLVTERQTPNHEVMVSNPAGAPGRALEFEDIKVSTALVNTQ